MIEAIYDESKGTLTVQGHAGAGEYGRDLVCAAASILVHTAIKAAGRDAACRAETGFAQITAGECAMDALRVVMAGFEWLAENYPGNVKAKRR